MRQEEIGVLVQLGNRHCLVHVLFMYLLVEAQLKMVACDDSRTNTYYNYKEVASIASKWRFEAARSTQQPMSYDLNIRAAKTKSPPLIFCLHLSGLIATNQKQQKLLIKAENKAPPCKFWAF